MSKNIIEKHNLCGSGLICLSLIYCILQQGIALASDYTKVHELSSPTLRGYEKKAQEMLKQENLPDSDIEIILEGLIYILAEEYAFKRQQPYYKRLLVLRKKLYGKDSAQFKQCEKDYHACLVKAKKGIIQSPGDPNWDSGWGYPTKNDNVKMIPLPPLLKGNILPYKNDIKTIILNAWSPPPGVDSPTTIAICLSKEGKFVKADIVESGCKEGDDYALQMLQKLTFPAFPKWYDGEPLTFKFCLPAPSP
jgi:hypothetical protein